MKIVEVNAYHVRPRWGFVEIITDAVIQEQSIGIHYNVGKSVLDYALNKQDFQFVDGFCAMPTKPGLGIEVNKELVLEENLTKHQWKNPIWRHADGSVAEW